MEPSDTGRAYDAIARWWTDATRDSRSGFAYLAKAIAACRRRRTALDVGCGAGRLVGAMEDAGFSVTGIDVSAEMIRIVRANRPDAKCLHADICTWVPPEAYDLVVAWDSTFHVPYERQADVVRKLCLALAEGGVVLFTAGGVDGTRAGTMNGQAFYHSSLSVEAYLTTVEDMGCKCILFERDQYPEEHVVFVVVKGSSDG